MDEVVCPPGFQTYVPPPPAVMVVALPAQIVSGEEIVAVGGEFMVTVAVVIAVAFNASVMVTE